jgi:serine/threonine protein phosphatase PrpC
VWDSHQRPAPSQFLAAGRLYVVADGVSRCSDGHLASQTAVQAIHAA